MRKKRIFAALAACLLLCCLALPAMAADSGEDVISLRLHSDIAGCTYANGEQLLEILSAQVVLHENPEHAVSISDAAGTGEYAHMDAGRSYVIEYTLVAAPGYTLPDTLGEDDISLDCDKGVDVVYCRITDMYAGKNDDGTTRTLRTLRICAKVVVDGRPLQRILGWLYDIYLRIRAWSLY